MKTIARRILNLSLWLIFSLMVATGLLLEFRLPPGREGGHGLTVFGLDRHEWGDWHLVIGYLFLALIICHMALAWPWLKKVAAKGKLVPVIVGLVFGVLIMLSAFFLPVKSGDAGVHHDADEQVHQHENGLGRGYHGGGRRGH